MSHRRARELGIGATSVRRGVRQSRRSTSTWGGGANFLRPSGKPTTRTAALTPASPSSRPITLTEMKRVEIIIVIDKTIKIVTIITATALSHLAFTHGPIKARSLHNSNTVIVVLGNIRPQMA